MSVLLDRQFLFTRLLARWIEECFLRGYAVKLRETGLLEKRKSRLKIPFKDGVHSSPASQFGGLHYLQLATDADLFTQVPETGAWRYVSSTDHPAWQAMGEHWESLDPLCRWGGRFTHADGNHLSITYRGRA
jgi:hypothetical protein